MKRKELMLVEGRAEKSTREYKRGNWTLNETTVLIEAKKMDHERRMNRPKERENSSRIPQDQTRWKWVEDHCWRHGCCRSQNQCNDRWDNLMRDYKKVRAYELGLGAGNDSVSYWKLERHERKKRSLPCNLLPEIYEALHELVQKREVERASVGVSVLAGTVVEERQATGSISCSVPPLVTHTSPITTMEEVSEPPSSLPHAQPLAMTDSEESGHSDLNERKRKREESSTKSSTHDLSSAIDKCGSILAEALQASERKEELRHKDLMNIEERKAKLDESKSEITAQSIKGFAAAINKLASSILDIVTDKSRGAQE